MHPLTTNLTLAPDASIDLHMHTNFSDGRWPAQQLIDFLVTEGYALVSVTDHDRVDTHASNPRISPHSSSRADAPAASGMIVTKPWNRPG